MGRGEKERTDLNCQIENSKVLVFLKHHFCYSMCGTYEHISTVETPEKFYEYVIIIIIIKS